MKSKGILLSLMLMGGLPLDAAIMVDFPLAASFGGNPRQPQGIALGADGHVWVGGLGTNSILVVSAGGVVLAEYPIPSPGAQPFGLAAGPDGAVWFTEYGRGAIGRVSPAGVFTEYALPSVASQPYFICAGPDGALWFTEYAGNRIGRITTSGVLTEFTVSGSPTGICPGPDGALWFTEYSGSRIGRITTGGTVTEFTVPTAGSFPYAIAAGPGGALWFTESGGNKIGRVTTAGVFTEFPIPSPAAGLGGIFAGPDGNVWFAETSRGRVGRVAADGTVAEFLVPGGSQAQPSQFSTGPLGTFWYTEYGSNAVTRVDLSDPLVQYALPGNAVPIALAAGPDGAVWYVTSEANIGRVSTSGVVTLFPVPRVSYSSAISPGSDGALWFVASPNAMGRITTSGAASELPLPPNGNWPSPYMTLGPDANVWFARYPSLGRITPLGGVMEWTLSTQTTISGLASGPDGNVWAVLSGSSGVVRMTPFGGQTTFALPPSFYSFNGLTSGPDGNLWIASGYGMVRMTTTGISTPVPITLPWYSYSGFSGVASGPDGNLWGISGGHVVRFTTAGTFLDGFTMQQPGGGGSSYGRIVAGPGDTMWFLDGSASIGKVTIPPTTSGDGWSFHTLTPCRVLDTRNADGPYGGPSLSGYSSRRYVAAGACGVPLTARALSVNVTAVSSGLGYPYRATGDLLLYAADVQQSVTGTAITYMTGRDRANNALVKLSSDGAGAFLVYNNGGYTMHVVLDVNGWFE